MSKIPKNLSDKDMFKDYVEDTSIEDRFRAAEKKAEKKAKESVEAPADFLRAGFTPQLTEELAPGALAAQDGALPRGCQELYLPDQARWGENRADPEV